MELSPANKAALLLRFSAMFGDDRSYPGWNGLTLADQLEWQRCDPEAAAIAKGDVSAPHEAWLCTNQLSPEMRVSLMMRLGESNTINNEQ